MRKLKDFFGEKVWRSLFLLITFLNDIIYMFFLHSTLVMALKLWTFCWVITNCSYTCIYLYKRLVNAQTCWQLGIMSMSGFYNRTKCFKHWSYNLWIANQDLALLSKTCLLWPLYEGGHIWSWWFSGGWVEVVINWADFVHSLPYEIWLLARHYQVESSFIWYFNKSKTLSEVIVEKAYKLSS